MRTFTRFAPAPHPDTVSGSSEGGLLHAVAPAKKIIDVSSTGTNTSRRTFHLPCLRFLEQRSEAGQLPHGRELVVPLGQAGAGTEIERLPQQDERPLGIAHESVHHRDAVPGVSARGPGLERLACHTQRLVTLAELGQADGQVLELPGIAWVDAQQVAA